MAKKPARKPEAADREAALAERKKRHLEICLDAPKYTVEYGSAWFEHLTLIHTSLPELSTADLDTRTTFLGHAVALPILISSMTGGSDEGYRANKDLARAAQESGIPVGMGSIRILFRKPEVFEHFYLKKYAPDVPVIANLSVVQLRDLPVDEVTELLKRLEVQGLVLHLNPGQELFQTDGDRDFRGLYDTIARYIDMSPVPILVKETGFGIRPAATQALLSLGVDYVNVAGAGGTNWVSVEGYRHDEWGDAPADFETWGLPTAVLLDATHTTSGRVIASGGIRTGVDVAKATALGAAMCGVALPFIRAVFENGVDGVLAKIAELRKSLETAMLLTESRDISTLQGAPLLRSVEFSHRVEQLSRIETGAR
jgi:isopentenyl-diphosphate Delta-isomerase